MNLIEIVESFSKHKELLEIEKCYEDLIQYKKLARRYKNYGHLDQVSIDGIELKKISVLYQAIKFEKSLITQDFKSLEESFRELYKSYFTYLYKSNFDMWLELYEMLKIYNSKIFQVNSILVELELLLEVLTSFKYKVAIPNQRKIQQVVELLLMAKEKEAVISTLVKYFKLTNDKNLEKVFYNAIPKARNKKFSDNFLVELKDYSVKRDIRIDVLVDNFELPESKEPEHVLDLGLSTFGNYSEVFGTLVGSIKLNKSNRIDMYISDGNFDKASSLLETEYSNKEKDLTYDYLRLVIEKKQHGAMSALQFAKKNDLLEKALKDKNILEIIQKCKAEVLIKNI